VVAHGGAGSPEPLADGCARACEAAFKLLERGEGALDAVVAGVGLLEDDGRYNAGRGSALRLDGRTVEMDAAVMDSAGNLGMAIAVRNVKNPVVLARSIMDTPHVALAGQGAEAFARGLGLPPMEGVSDRALERYRKLKRLMLQGRAGDSDPRWQGKDIRALWNFPGLPYGEVFPSDTVGMVALDRDGVFASANSTGGAPPMMLGRVGDCAMPGCGFYAGPGCAVAVTGVGEEIVRRMLARSVYEMVLKGIEVKAACQRGVAMFPADLMAGVIAISGAGYGVSANTRMPHYALVREG
jgi:beta-aspartyl-peptidase (threonine type)